MNYKTTPLKDLLGGKGYIRGPFGSALKRAELKSEGIPVYEQQHAIYNSRDFRYFIDEKKYDELKRFTIIPNDLIISCSGTVGKISIIRKHDPVGIISQALLILRPNSHMVLTEFLYYFFSSPIGFNELMNASQGAVQLNIAPRNIVEKIPIPVPQIDEQKKIVKVLKDLDDKIALNTQINQTLEAMAQALFKSWFVDFDPVKAKMKARASGGDNDDVQRAAMSVISGKGADELEQFERNNPQEYKQLVETADLFPEALVESQLGLIPEGWEVKTVGEVALLNSNSWTKRNAPIKVEYVDLANTKWGTIQSTEVYEFESAPSRARRILKNGDTIIGTVRPGNGSYAYIGTDGLTGSTGFAVLTPKDRMYSELIYLTTTSNENIEKFAHLADGGAYPAVSPEVVLNTNVVLPSLINEQEQFIHCFSKTLSSIFQKIENHKAKNMILTQIRDTLLPKLLSGEIDLSGFDVREVGK